MPEQELESSVEPTRRPWAKWIAVGGFWFFLLKGIGWLIVAAVAWMLATD